MRRLSTSSVHKRSGKRVARIVNIVHFSRTPLAGGPIRLVRALQQHTKHNVRLVDLQRWGRFEHDIVYEENPGLVADMAAKADIIHLHNYLDLESHEFYPVDFAKLHRKGKAVIRQFHSHPDLVAKVMGKKVEGVILCGIPSLVIAQFQERFYPNARVVPSIIPQNDALYSPSLEPPLHKIVFCPTGNAGAWGERWNTKGSPETMAMLRRVGRRTGYGVDRLTGAPLGEVIRAKRAAAVVIDELVTGSYHLSGLEGLSVGRPTLCYLDPRVQRVMREISGAPDLPFLSVRLEDAYEVLLNLLRHPDEMIDIGLAARRWIEEYWSDHVLVQHFVDIYEKLVSNPHLVVRQEPLQLSGRGAYYFAVTVPDAVHESRKARYLAALPIRIRMWGCLKRYGKVLYDNVARCLPSSLKGLLRSARSFIRRSLTRREEQD